MKVYIIAEAGVNHNGDITLAKKLIDVAAIAGADCVKFQTFKADNLTTKEAKKASYQMETTTGEDTQYNMLKSLELTYEMHLELIAHCQAKGIQFLSTAFDHDSVDLLEELNIPLFKIPSGELTNYPLLKKIASLNKPIILSTGMATLDEIKDAVNYMVRNGANKESITLLHCNTEYPTPMEDVNLNAMQTIKNEFSVKVGYSDHTLGIEVPIAAVTMGATVIEKHFTLDCTLPGPDHKASLEPEGLKSMVTSIRNIEKAMGNSIKQPSESEKKNIVIARKSIVAAKDIQKGELFSEDNLICKRPGDGLSGVNYDILLGKVANESYYQNSKIKGMELE